MDHFSPAICILPLLVLVLLSPAAFAQQRYEKPPQPILDVLNAPLPPTFFLSPTRDTAVLSQPVRYPPIADLAEPMLRLAGVRINPRTDGLHGDTYWVGLTLKKIPNGVEFPIPIPTGARIGVPRWNAVGTMFAFTINPVRPLPLGMGI